MLKMTTETRQVPPLMNPADLRSPARWPMDPDLTFLNHGSYGLCPVAVSEAQRQIRAAMERDPVRFFKADLERLTDETRRRLATLVNCPQEHLALTPNATLAVSTVLHAADLRPGDEIVATDHEYMATFNGLEAIVRRAGATIVRAPVPFPQVTPDDVVAAIDAAISPRTKLIVCSHIASASALVFPAARIAELAHERGIDILLDGAHAPGQVPIDLEALKPTYYAASCHKWLCTPKGTGFFYAAPHTHERIKPWALSCRVHELRDDRAAFLCDFDYVGTNDYSGNLTIPSAIDHLSAQIEGGLDALMRRNHDLVVEGARVVCDRAGLPQPVPESMIGSMIGIRLPDNPAPERPSTFDDPIWDALLERHNIQVPIWELPGVAQRIMRISAQLYNRIEDYERLGDALAEELRREHQLAKAG